MLWRELPGLCDSAPETQGRAFHLFIVTRCQLHPAPTLSYLLYISTFICIGNTQSSYVTRLRGSQAWPSIRCPACFLRETVVSETRSIVSISWDAFLVFTSHVSRCYFSEAASSRKQLVILRMRFKLTSRSSQHYFRIFTPGCLGSNEVQRRPCMS